MRKLFTAIILLSSLRVLSQDNALYNNCSFLTAHFVQDPLFNTSFSRSATLMVNGDAYLVSNALTQQFFLKVLGNGYIGNYIKTNVSHYLQPFNAVDFNYNFSLTYRQRLSGSSDSSNSNLLISIGTRSLNSVRFTNDDFNLIFYGNAMYAGQTAYLTGSNASLIYFNQLKIGWNKNKMTSSGHSVSYGLAASFLQGRKDFNLNVAKGTLYTQQDGEYIDAGYNFVYNRSDTSASTLSTFNGIGASLDGFIREKIKNFTMCFAVSDVGFINWSPNSLQANADSFIHFTGYNASDIFHITDTAFNQIKTDSILHVLGVKEHKQSYSTQLPFRLELSFSNYFSSWQSTLAYGVVYWHYSPSQFIVFAKLNHTFGNHFIGGASADVNSIGAFEIGLNGGIRLGGLSIFVSLGNLIENIAPALPTCTTGNVSLLYSF